MPLLVAIIFTALLPDGASHHWHTEQPHATPLWEQMDHEEMGDITRSADAEKLKRRLAGCVQVGSAMIKGRKQKLGIYTFRGRLM